MTLSTIAKIRTHNIWMLSFSVFWFIAFISLGVWQITRGFEKQQQLSSITDLAPPLTSMSELQAIQSNAELFFRPIKLRGKFLPQSFLLDNSIFYDMQIADDATKSPYCFLLGDCGRKTGKVRVGFRVFGLFAPTDGLQTLLVERGWLEVGADRNALPDVSQAQVPSDASGDILIDAVVMPDAGKRRVLKADTIDTSSQWQILQRIDADTLSDALQLDIYPQPLIMTATSPAAMERFAPLANYSYLNPARHFGYAVQWFLMAIALLSVYLVFYYQTNSAARNKKD